MLSKDDVLKMARQAGFMLVTDSQEGQSDWYECFTEEIEAFAKLVAEKAVEREREACIHACREIYSAWMCETDEDVDAPDPNDCIRAIRARGQA